MGRCRFAFLCCFKVALATSKISTVANFSAAPDFEDSELHSDRSRERDATALAPKALHTLLRKEAIASEEHKTSGLPPDPPQSIAEEQSDGSGGTVKALSHSNTVGLAPHHRRPIPVILPSDFIELAAERVEVETLRRARLSTGGLVVMLLFCGGAGYLLYQRFKPRRQMASRLGELPTTIHGDPNEIAKISKGRQNYRKSVLMASQQQNSDTEEDEDGPPQRQKSTSPRMPSTRSPREMQSQRSLDADGSSRPEVRSERSTRRDRSSRQDDQQEDDAAPPSRPSASPRAEALRNSQRSRQDDDAAPSRPSASPRAEALRSSQRQEVRTSSRNELRTSQGSRQDVRSSSPRPDNDADQPSVRTSRATSYKERMQSKSQQ